MIGHNLRLFAQQRPKCFRSCLFIFLYFLVLFSWKPSIIFMPCTIFVFLSLMYVIIFSQAISLFIIPSIISIFHIMPFYHSAIHRRIQTKAESFLFQAIDMFMSSCTVFVFLSLIEYAFVNVMMGDISEVEQKAKKNHLRNITYQIVLT